MQKQKDVGAQVTVFLSLVMMCLFAFFCVLLESARTAGARWYLRTVVSSAMDSVFAQYHREVWDSYRLFFAEYDAPEKMEADFASYLQPYLEAKNWYPMELASVTAENQLFSVDDDAVYFEKEILDYMKFGFWRSEFQAEEAKDIIERGKDAVAVKDTATLYRKHAKQALKLEKVLEEISENLNRQGEWKREGLSCLQDYDGSGFREQARSLIKELEKMPDLVEKYRKQADKLAEDLAETRKKVEAKSDEMSAESMELMMEEIREYEDYVSEDGVRRREIEALEEKSREQIAFVEEVIEESLEVEQEIDDWESDDEDDDGPDLEELWSPVERHFRRLEIPRLSFSYGVKDKEKENLLEKVEELFQDGVLTLLIPGDRELSGKTVDLSEVPSAEHGESKRKVGIASHFIVNQYDGIFFKNFCTGQKKDQGDSGSGKKETEKKGVEDDLFENQSDDENRAVQAFQIQQVQASGIEGVEVKSGRKVSLDKDSQGDSKDDSKDSAEDKDPNGDTDSEETMGNVNAHPTALDYEVEYLIAGKDSDKANLMGALERLLAVREGLNLIHILSDSQKRSEARKLAMEITGLASASPLILVTTFLVMSVWALGESLMDIRGLLAGKKTPIWKKKEDWKLELSALLSIGENRKVEEGGGKRGLSYLSWLKILLLLGNGVTQEYRMMDLIEKNIQLGQREFHMRDCLYQSEIWTTVEAKRVFFSLGFVERQTGGGDPVYQMELLTERAY
ncbi:DUF5702 domain-containing protein [Brotaphodocola sp.]|uniref:DUF5702 domain-containing protein n=1 Tax=Brotaphodocola sp. TaxID=3073577 RepID=UPI003D7D6735